MNFFKLRLMVIILVTSCYCFSQEEKEYIPDGAQGELPEVIEPIPQPQYLGLFQ